MLMAVLLIAQLSGLGQESALANSAPPRYDGGKSGVLLPGESSQVHVLNESLSFDLAESLSAATVTARYTMENRGEALRDFPVLFVIQDRDGYEGERPVTVTWNGQMLPVTLLGEQEAAGAKAEEVRQAWGAMEATFDPVTGAFYTEPFYGTPGLSYLQFPLNLAAGAGGVLETYHHAAAEDRTRYAHRLYHYHYLLSPAKGWASFGPVEIRIKAPGPKQAFFGANLDFTYIDGEYRAELPGLPDENLAFGVMSREGLIGGMVQPGPYYWMAFVILLAAAWLVGQGFGRLAARLRIQSRGWVIGIGVLGGALLGGLVDAVLVPLIFALFPALGGEGYGLAIIGFIQWFVAVLVTIITAGVVAGRRRPPA